MVKEEAKLNDIKDQFEEAKETGTLRDEDEVRVNRRIGALDEKWAELNRTHDDNHRRYGGCGQLQPLHCYEHNR